MKLDFDTGLRPIGPEQLDEVSGRAGASRRRRAIARYHDHADKLQRMLNAMEPGTYVCPHRHASPAKVEVFLALRGAAEVLTFSDAGEVLERREIRPGGGVEIPPGTWHTVVSLEPGTVLYELIEGPYDADTHKEFAPWAPPEGSPEGLAWIASR